MRRRPRRYGKGDYAGPDKKRERGSEQFPLKRIRPSSVGLGEKGRKGRSQDELLTRALKNNEQNYERREQEGRESERKRLARSGHSSFLKMCEIRT